MNLLSGYLGWLLVGLFMFISVRFMLFMVMLFLGVKYLVRECGVCICMV